MKILLIDDDVDLLFAYRLFLESKGHEVLTAYDGKSGMEHALRDNPDLIVLDVMMSQVTEGFDVARHIRSDSGLSRTPIIMLSGIRKSEKLPWTFEPDVDWLPVTRFMEKPVSPDDLLAEITDILTGD